MDVDAELHGGRPVTCCYLFTYNTFVLLKNIFSLSFSDNTTFLTFRIIKFLFLNMEEKNVHSSTLCYKDR